MYFCQCVTQKYKRVQTFSSQMCPRPQHVQLVWDSLAARIASFSDQNWTWILQWIPSMESTYTPPLILFWRHMSHDIYPQVVSLAIMAQTLIAHCDYGRSNRMEKTHVVIIYHFSLTTPTTWIMGAQKMSILRSFHHFCWKSCSKRRAEYPDPLEIGRVDVEGHLCLVD